MGNKGYYCPVRASNGESQWQPSGSIRETTSRQVKMKQDTPAYVKVKRHNHTGVPAKARFLRLLCRGISNAPVEASAKTYPDMYLHRQTHTGCLQRHVYTGSFAEAY